MEWAYASTIHHAAAASHAGGRKPRGKGWLTVLAVVCAHLLAIQGLLQLDAVHSAVRELAPVVLAFVVPPEPANKVAPPPLPTPPLLRAPTPAPLALPQVPRAAVTTEAPPVPAPAAEATPAAAAPATAPADVSAGPPAAIVQAHAPSAPPTPTALPSSAVQYLVQPPVEVPAASRRLGEQGTVWLRVRVGRDGLPLQIALQQSSGYERLDRQALEAMRQARFKPQMQNGQAIEWIVTAPLRYDIE